jgi:hypothetical protein
MSQAAGHQDADRLSRAVSGLPPDVHDPAAEAAYQQLAGRPAAKQKTAAPKPTKKGGSG